MDTTCTAYKLEDMQKVNRLGGPREILNPYPSSPPNKEGIRGSGKHPTVPWEDKEATQRKLLKLSIQGYGPGKSKEVFYLYHHQFSTTVSLKYVLQNSALKEKHNEANIWWVPSTCQVMCSVFSLLLLYLILTKILLG